MSEHSTERSFVASDVKAFEKIFREYSRELYLIAVGLCDDPAVAEDAVQESFIYLWGHRGQLDPAYPVINYLRTSVKNYVMNYFRHMKVRMNHEEEIIREHLFLHEEEEDWTPKIEAVRQVIDTLPENCRKIFIMSVIEGMSYADTAKNMDVSVNTVKSQVKIAYRKIKKIIQENPDNTVYISIFLMSLKKMM